MKLLRKKRYIVAALSLLLVAGLFVSAKKNDFQVGKNLEILFNLFREVHTYYVDPTDPDQLMKNSASGMLSELDPYTEFLSEEDMKAFEIAATGKYGGIGSLIRQRGDWVYIAQPYRGFAADKAGLKIGDKILAVDGVNARGMGATEISNRMKGDPGTPLKLRIERYTDGTEEDLVIRRERIVISGVPYYGMLNDSVGYILHEDFSEDCSSDIRNSIMELKRQGMQSLVLDLRGNGGGMLPEAVKIVGMFVPKGSEVVSIKGKTAETNAVYRTTANPIDLEMPIAVLIGRGSASAAEIVAGALQDMDRAVLIGQRSFGKGLVQTTRPVGYNSYVKLTTAKYYIPSGRCIQAIDYSHRNEEGGVEYVPDSLIKEFATLSGRKVYDGGGIMPDVILPAESYSLFTINLYAKSYIEDFAMEYVKKHRFQPIDVDSFHLSDADYADFVAFMQDKEVDYESETQMALEMLKKTAEKEKYNDRISAEIESITNKISKNKNMELELLKPEISKLIEDDIVLYYHYAQGVTRHNLSDDTTVAEAVALLADPERYSRILASQDTKRN